jgi:chemotaxis protein methyltransferase CheR
VTAASKPGFDDLLRYVEAELGFATSHYNDSYLDRRVNARMRRTGAESYAEYLDQLAADDSEGERLLDALSINVTSFFRNPPMWEVLRSVLRTLSAERRRTSVWSAACSDGREAYSLAMLAADDPEVDESRVSITATDISEPALEKAREAVYRSTRTTDIAEEIAPLSDHEPYLLRREDRFEVRPAVRMLVDFRRHDLIRDEPIGEFDLVLCRNLFIYIDPEFKEPILSTIDSSLADGGYLVIGMAETLPPEYRGRFEPVANRSRVHRRVD